MASVTSSDGVRLNYVDEGEGAAVVLIAGFANPRSPELRPLPQDHAEADRLDVIARLGVPGLFLAGRQGQFWPWQHATAMAGTNKPAEAVVLDECGHAADLDQPDLVNAAILEFLR
jgi:non-heme chloroperoxidase